MPDDSKLTAGQVKDRYGLNRNDLIALEASGKIKPSRTDGGQRRYDAAQLQAMRAGTVAEPKKADYSEFGTTGMRRWGGNIYEEKLRELRGRAGQILYREMKINDPVIGAVFYAIENTLKQANWRVKPASEAQEDKDCAIFIEQCHPEGTLIRTSCPVKQGVCASGNLVPIEQIKVGDKVITHSGKARTVTNTFRREHEGPVYAFRRMFSTEVLVATPNHPVLIRPKEEMVRRIADKPNRKYNKARFVSVGVNSKYQWTPAEDIEIGDYLVEPIDYAVHDIESIDLAKYRKGKFINGDGAIYKGNQTVNVTDDFARFLGYFIAEGSASDRNSNLRFCFHRDEFSYINDVVDIAKTCFGLEATLDTSREQDDNCTIIDLNSALLCRFLRDEFYNGSKKTLPGWFRKLPDGKVLNFIIGMMRGDGHIDRCSIGLTIGDRDLAEYVRQLFLRLNIVASLKLCNPKESNIKGHPVFTKSHCVLSLSGDHARRYADLAELDYGKDHVYDAGSRVFISCGCAHYPVTHIDITNVDGMDVYNLEVEQDHSFIANGVSSHNCLDDQSFSWTDTLAFITEFLTAGYSCLEIIYKLRLGDNPPRYCDEPATSQYNDGRVGWRKWAPRPAESLADGDEWIFDDAGGVQGIRQQPDSMNGDIREIPIEKLLLFRTTPAPANSPAGMPIHRSMYTAYYYTRALQEIEGIGVERDLGGLPVVYLGQDCTTNETDPNSDYNLAKDLVTNLRNDEQAGVVIPHHKMGTGADGTGMLLELLSASSGRAHDVGQIIERYDKLKALAVLAQFIMLGLSRVGSFALSKHQGDLFSIAVASWLINIAEVINRYAIPRLLRYNSFPGITGRPKLVPSALGLQSLDDVTTYINALFGKGLITPDPELERHLRQLAKLPEAPPKPEGEEKPTPAAGEPPRTTAENAMLLRRLLGVFQDMQATGTGDADLIGAMIDELTQELNRGVVATT